jgi:hypothetical protein
MLSGTYDTGGGWSMIQDANGAPQSISTNPSNGAMTSLVVTGNGSSWTINVYGDSAADAANVANLQQFYESNGYTVNATAASAGAGPAVAFNGQTAITGADGTQQTTAGNLPTPPAASGDDTPPAPSGDDTPPAPSGDDTPPAPSGPPDPTGATGAAGSPQATSILAGAVNTGVAAGAPASGSVSAVNVNPAAGAVTQGAVNAGVAAVPTVNP